MSSVALHRPYQEERTSKKSEASRQGQLASHITYIQCSRLAVECQFPSKYQ